MDETRRVAPPSPLITAKFLLTGEGINISNSELIFDERGIGCDKEEVEGPDLDAAERPWDLQGGV